MDFKKKRWISLYAGFVIVALAGNGYAWSVYQMPLVEKYGWTISQVSISYTTGFLSGMFISLFFGAKLRKMFKTRTEVFIGGLLYGGAIFMLSQMTGQLWQLVVLHGMVGSLGVSMSYPVLIAYSQEIFPEKPGFAGGIMAAGYGLGAVIWAPLATKIYTSTGDISSAFFYLGITFMVGMASMSLLLFTPPEGFRERMIAEAAETGTGEKVRTARVREVVYDIDKPELIRTPLFYMMMVTVTLGIACGGMIINQGSPIVQLKFGMTATEAATVVGSVAVGNTIGRFLWGTVSDRIGKVETVKILHVLQIIFMSTLLIVSSKTLFVLALMGTTFCYGGLACLLAPVTGELFGNANISANYSVAYSAYGLSSLLGPLVIANIRQTTGEYTLGYVVAIVFSFVALAAALFIEKRANQIRKENVAGQFEVEGAE